MIECFSCKGMYPESNGPTHSYMKSSQGCWQIYGEILAREYSDVAYWKNHRLTVDAYAAQHPGVESAQSIQSVAVHLMSLYFVIEEGRPHDVATQLIKKATKQKFYWLQPPINLGGVNATIVWASKNAKEHNNQVELWARSVWKAWEEHHEIIKKWVKEVENT